MNVTLSEPLFFNHICNRGIIVEYLEDNPYTLTTIEHPLPGCNLKYEYAALTSEHRPVASGLFRWFRSAISHCNSQNGRELVNEIVEVFRHYKDDLSVNLREYVLSEGIIEVCYRVQIEDSQLMKHVLDLLYESWSSFGSLHFSAILKPSYFEESSRRRNANSNQPDFLTFYLEHTRRLKLKYNGARFIDVSVYSSIRKVPVIIAADMWCWKSLLRYLQFGAKCETVMVNSSVTRHGVRCALTDTLHKLIRHLWVRLVRPATALSLTDPEEIQEYCNNVNRDVRDLCRTLKIILRAVKHLRHDVLEFVIPDHSNQQVEHVNSSRVINHPTVHLMVPTLSLRYRCPMQLQHACKCAIRNRLNENWQLPAGINSLKIPIKMKKYLNLLSD